MPDIMIDYITISWRDRGSENLFVSTNTMASISKIEGRGRQDEISRTDKSDLSQQFIVVTAEVTRNQE